MQFSVSSKIHTLALTILLCVLCGTVALAQNKQDLEKKKKELNKDIETTAKLLSETRENQKVTLSQLKAIGAKITIREKLIGTISYEIGSINKLITQNNNEINSLSTALAKLKSEYAAMILFAYRNKNAYQKLMFIFAASDFNQAYKRLKYIQQFNDFRRHQANDIETTQVNINDKIISLEKKKLVKSGLLIEEQKEKVALDEEKQSQTKISDKLKDQEKKLRKDLKDKQKQAERLQKAIEDIIRKEIEEARRKEDAANKAKGIPAPKDAKPLSNLPLTPAAAKLSADFANNIGKLPWPVEKGIIVEYFGDHEHPVLKGVMVRNNGIDIKTSANAQARAVFEGTVTGVVSVGGQVAVIVRHGQYLSVYSQLKSASVKTGDKITTKQNLGTVDTGDDDTELHLEIWKDSSKLNPVSWLAVR